METKELEVQEIDNAQVGLHHETKDVQLHGQDLMGMFAEDASRGLEQAGSEDYAVPFLTILQKGSPQVSRANAKYIKGAEQGMLYNTVTGKIRDGETGVDFVPCAFSSSVVEWHPRESGGGLVAHHAKSDQVVASAKLDPTTRKLVLPNGNIVIDTSYHFGLVLVEGAYEWAVIGMSSTQKKVSRQWCTRMANLRMPSGKPFPTFSHVYHLSTKPEQRDQFDWFGWKIGDPRVVTDATLYVAAREFAKQVLSGGVRMSAPTEDMAPEGGSGAPSNGQDEQVPF